MNTWRARLNGVHDSLYDLPYCVSIPPQVPMLALWKKQRKVGPDQKYDPRLPKGLCRGGESATGPLLGPILFWSTTHADECRISSKAGLGYLEILTHEMEVSSRLEAELAKDFGCTKEET